MLNLPLSPQYVIGPALIAVISSLFWFFDSSALPLFAYDQSAVEHFQWWRFITGNLVHSNLAHLLLNLVGLFAIWGLHGDYYKTRGFLLLTLVCGLGVTFGMYFLNPETTHYVGLSGALHGVFAWGTFKDVGKGYKSGWILMSGLGIKLFYEQMYGGNPELAAMIGNKISIESHLYGAATGLIIAVLQPILKRIR